MKIVAWVIFAVAIAFAAYTHLTVDIVPSDDAFIIYRYVDNAIDGNGLVYNEGENLFGASTPLYCAWLCLLKTVVPGWETPQMAVRTNLLFYILTAALILLIVYRLTSDQRIASLAGAFFLIHPVMLDISWLGMESIMFCALLAGGIYGLLTKRLLLAAILTGLAAVTRPEGILLVPITIVVWYRYRDTSPILFFGGLLIAPAIWVIFATLFYGTPIPHSIQAKIAPLYPLLSGTALERIVREVTKWTFGSFDGRRLISLRALLPMLSLNLLLITTIAAVVGKKKDLLANSISPGVLLLLFLFFYITNPLMLSWYWAPIFMLWLIVVIVGLYKLIGSIGNLLSISAVFQKRLQKWLPIIAVIIFCILPGKMIFDTVLTTIARENNPYTDSMSAVRARISGYRDAGLWLAENAPADSEVASPEIGALGFYWPGKILDACGLVSQSALPFLPVPNEQRHSAGSGAISIEFVRDTKPDYVVTMYVFAYRSLFNNDWFKENYKLVNRIPLATPLSARGWAGSNEVLIFRSAI